MTLNPARIENENQREVVIRYQRESFEAIHNYWEKGQATNPRVIAEDFAENTHPYPPELPMPGQRFAQERERLGYATRKDLAKATGLKTSVIAQFEELNCQTKRLQFLQILMDVGFDVRYWQSGRRSIWSPVTPQESVILLTLREQSSHKAGEIASPCNHNLIDQ